MKILVTGGTGFIGRHLIDALLSEHQIFSLVRDRNQLPTQENLIAIECDLANLKNLNQLPNKVDAIVHLAQANVPFPECANELFAVNIASTQWLANYAREAGVSNFVYTSSGNVYLPSTEPVSETSPVQPSDYYSLSKYCSEEMLKCYKKYFNISILRLFAPYGYSQIDRLIPKIINRVRSGQNVILFNGGQPRINPIYIDDLTKVIYQALFLQGYHVVNVAGPQIVSIKEIASIAGEILEYAPNFKNQEQSNCKNLIADIAQMKTLFQFKPTSIYQGIQHTIEGTNRSK